MCNSLTLNIPITYPSKKTTNLPIYRKFFIYRLPNLPFTEKLTDYRKLKALVRTMDSTRVS